MKGTLVVFFAMVFFALMALVGRAQKEGEKEAPKSCTVEGFNQGSPECELFRLRVQTKQQAAQLAYGQYQQALQVLSAEAEKTKKDNGWGDEVQYNMQAGMFVTIPKTLPSKTPPPETETPKK